MRGFTIACACLVVLPLVLSYPWGEGVFLPKRDDEYGGYNGDQFHYELTLPKRSDEKELEDLDRDAINKLLDYDRNMEERKRLFYNPYGYAYAPIKRDDENKIENADSDENVDTPIVKIGETDKDMEPVQQDEHGELDEDEMIALANSQNNGLSKGLSKEEAENLLKAEKQNEDGYDNLMNDQDELEVFNNLERRNWCARWGDFCRPDAKSKFAQCCPGMRCMCGHFWTQGKCQCKSKGTFGR